MSENPTGIISIDAAADMLMEPEKETPDADEAQNDEVEAEEIEVEAEAEEGETVEADDDEGDAELPEDDDEIEEDLVEIFDGKEWTTVDRDEAKGHGLRQADYTRKSMENAEIRKDLDAERETMNGQKAQLMDALARFATPTEQQPNWAEMAATMDPREYNRVQAEWATRQAQVDEARQYHTVLQEQAQQELMETEQAKLFEAFPEWKDPAIFQKSARDMTDGLTHYGFSEEETGAVMDHRMFRVAQDALKYRALQAAKPAVQKKVSKAATRLKPGGKVSKSQQKAIAQRQKVDRLKKSGSMDDALAAMVED